MAKDDGYELRLTLLERKIFLAGNEKEEVGPVRGNFLEYGGLSHIGHEPLHCYKDGNYRVHERSSK